MGNQDEVALGESIPSRLNRNRGRQNDARERFLRQHFMVRDEEEICGRLV